MEILNLKKHGRAIPSFLKKTYEMLEEQHNDHIVKWTSSGVGFMVLNEAEFSKVILPKYFKHNKYSSFVRQLNMYNFHKVRSNTNENCFIHEKFIRNDIRSIENIKRKPERKKKKMENDSASGDKQDSDVEDSDLQQLKLPTKQKRTPFVHKHSIPVISLRLCNKTLDRDEAVFHDNNDNNDKYFRMTSSDSNTIPKETPTTGVELQDFYDTISIQNQIENRDRSYLRIPTKLLLQNQGSGIFPLHVGMVSIYSLSNLIK